MQASTVTSEGQITLPPDVRRALGLRAGDKVEFVATENGYELVPVRKDVRALKGRFAGRVEPAASIDRMEQATADAAALSVASACGDACEPSPRAEPLPGRMTRDLQGGAVLLPRARELEASGTNPAASRPREEKRRTENPASGEPRAGHPHRDQLPGSAGMARQGHRIDGTQAGSE
ncbi:MAG: AbrB/MazE/SpoVT family DNA-binding domain-containing protein [Ectothiorhodospiraceae bacterium]|nr:AbrB/MazE/SpoVT family DNA-binding domain-containing protein [Ectothiorhodospiraceae bacterium]